MESVIDTEENEILFEMPATMFLAKSEGATEGRRMIRGYASNETSDEDGEIVLQKGIDYEPFRKNGFINWDHQYRYPIPGCKDIRVPVIIGYPTQVLMKSKGLWTEAELLNPDAGACEELRLANYAWELGTALQKSGSDRRLAYSVEGGIIARRGDKVVRSVVRAAALTWKPVNPTATVEMFQKSLCCGKCSPDHPAYNPAHSCSNKHVEVESLAALEKSVEANAMTTESASALLKQNLDRGMTTVLYGDRPDDCYDASTGRFHNGLTGAYKHMTDHLGHGHKETTQFLRKLIAAGAKNAGIAVLVKTAGLAG